MAQAVSRELIVAGGRYDRVQLYRTEKLHGLKISHVRQAVPDYDFIAAVDAEIMRRECVA